MFKIPLIVVEFIAVILDVTKLLVVMLELTIKLQEQLILLV